MRNYLLKLIDNIVFGLFKLRYWVLSNYTDPAAADFLARWKKAYPKTFDGSKVMPVSPIVEAVTNEELNTTFPPEESDGYSGH